MSNIKQIVVGFFKSLKCDVQDRGESVVIKNISEKIKNLFGIQDNLELNFKDSSSKGFVSEDSVLFRKIKEHLKSNPSKNLLRIDFEFPSNIREKISLRNCSIDKIEKKHEHNYFSRFSFLTTFRYLNKIEQVLNDFFVFEGKIIGGDLSSYNVQEGSVDDASTEHLTGDYHVAKEKLREFLAPKLQEISDELNKELREECNRVGEHYDKLIGEINVNKNRMIERLNDAKKELDEDKIKRIEDGLRNFDEQGDMIKIINEKNSVLENEKMKYSLDVENKLINTTIIYYPIFRIQLLLNEAGFNKRIEAVYDPLKNKVNDFLCDACKTSLDQINVCHGGHICCSSCLHICSECCKRFCRLCFAGVCESCGKLICKNCARTCPDCGKLFCKSCMRTSQFSGMERCLNCIGYCPVCSKSIEKKKMVKGKSGQMVCRGCVNK